MNQEDKETMNQEDKETINQDERTMNQEDKETMNQEDKETINQEYKETINTEEKNIENTEILNISDTKFQNIKIKEFNMIPVQSQLEFVENLQKSLIHSKINRLISFLMPVCDNNRPCLEILTSNNNDITLSQINDDIQIHIFSNVTKNIFSQSYTDYNCFSNYVEMFNHFLIDVEYPSDLFNYLNDNLSTVINSGKVKLRIEVSGNDSKSFQDKLKGRNFEKVIISSSMISIPPYSFTNLLISEITISSSVKTINQNTFQNCKKLTEVIFSTDCQIKEIKQQVFKNCILLSKIIIPHSVEIIGNNSFEGCKSLKQIFIPFSVKSINDNAFSKCTSLNEVIFDDHSKLQFICNSAFRECSSLQNITIPSNVKTINDHSFNSCKSIKNITILSYPNIIGKSSFDSWSTIQ